MGKVWGGNDVALMSRLRGVLGVSFVLRGKKLFALSRWLEVGGRSFPIGMYYYD
jgi:hypothetical protein